MKEHVQGDGQLFDVVKAESMVHTAIFMNPVIKTHFWSLTLSCGHTVERWIRWKQDPSPESRRRGYAAMHHSPSLDRLPNPPKKARCKDERRGSVR